MVFDQKADEADSERLSASSTMPENCVSSPRRACRRFGAIQGAARAEIAPTHFQRPAPSASFFHPDVCDMLAQAETIDSIVDNAHGRSLLIYVPSVIDCAGSTPNSNRARRRNGTMQGFGSADELFDHVPKQQSSSAHPPRMPVRRLTNESDEEDEKESAASYDYGDCLPRKPERRPTNEDQVDDDSSSSGKKATRRLGLSNNQRVATVPERRVGPRFRPRREDLLIHESKKSSAGKARRRLGLSNGQNSSIALEEPPRKLDGSEPVPLRKSQLEHYESDLSLEKMLLAPRLPTRQPFPSHVG